MLNDAQRAAWDRDGFALLRGFAEAETCRAMGSRAVEIARAAGGAGLSGRSLVMPENNLRDRAGGLGPEARVSKIFRLHREPIFRDFIVRTELLDLVAGLIGPELDCFLSQFIFKNPGAWGQPWHQDSFYFPFDRSPQVGIWLAVTDAAEDNGPLSVLPGSHREPVHDHVPDRRPGANLGYVEIVDHDMTGAIPVLMEPGDVLLFHSHLMHRSTDNGSDRIRAAMVYHCAQAGTRDLAPTASPVSDWQSVRRTTV